MPSITSSQSGRIAPDSYVTLHYRIELLTGPAAGSVFADTFSARPATLQMGRGQWADGIEAHLIGLSEGDQHEFDVCAEQAYGDRKPDLIQKVSRELVARHSETQTRFELGDIVKFPAPDGSLYSGVLKEIGDTWLLFDFNHPLAGIDLRVEVFVLGVLS